MLYHIQLESYLFRYIITIQKEDIEITNLIIFVQSNSPPIPTSMIATSTLKMIQIH
jgi:hypothetical protein